MCTTFTEVLAPTLTSKNRAMTWAPADAGCGVLTVTDSRSHTRYAVCEFDIARGFAGRAFKLTKSTREIYVVRFGPGSDMSCDCKGFTYGGGKRTCKHVDACRELIANDWLKTPADEVGDELETVADVAAEVEERDAYYQSHPIHEDLDMNDSIDRMVSKVTHSSPPPLTPTLRDTFAAHALQGILAAHSDETALPSATEAAKWAYEMADAMVARRCVSAPN